MARRVYICKKGELEDAIKEAKALGIAEVAEGIPPRFAGIVSEDSLPTVFEEPEPEPEPSPVLPDDRERLLEGRKAIESRRRALIELSGTKLVVLLAQADTKLRTLGFDSETEFMGFNQRLCYQEVERCYEIIGVCDHCEGREQGCIQGCYTERSEPISGESRLPLERRPEDFYDWQYFEEFVPPGCTIRDVKIAEPEFDIYWGMPTGITLEKYQEMKQREGEDGS